MKRGIRLGGLPVHAMLSHFPMGGLTATHLWDLLSFSPWAEVSPWHQFAFWSLAISIATAVPTSLLGLIDYAALPEKKAPLRAALNHAGMMGTSLTLYTISLIIRMEPGVVGTTSRPAAAAMVLAGVGFLFLAIGGHWGAKLVFVHGTGVTMDQDQPRHPREPHS